MKQNDWNAAIDNISDDIIERYVQNVDNFSIMNKRKRTVRRVCLFSCLGILIVTSILTFIILNDSDNNLSPDNSQEILLSETNTPAPTVVETPEASDPPVFTATIAPQTSLPHTNTPVVETPQATKTPQASKTPVGTATIPPHTSEPEIVRIPFNCPEYYGTESSIGSSGGSAELRDSGISVTAKFIKALPDTYTFFDDWRQIEYGLIKMETVKLLKGQEMAEEFYYLVPMKYMTDFSGYHLFVLDNMAQIGYEKFVLYNKTTGFAEQFNAVLFGYSETSYHIMGARFMAFDEEGNIDYNLWESDENWNVTKPSSIKTINDAEKAAKNDTDYVDAYCHSINNAPDKTKKLLEEYLSLEKGLYVPRFNSSIHFNSPECSLTLVRYVNGFATNESIRVDDEITRTAAQFTENDLKYLPDLASAMDDIISMFEAGEIMPPHIEDVDGAELIGYGVFGWYAKTENGVVGIVRVNWKYSDNKHDDAYYVIEYGNSVCREIDRDSLLSLLGEYESTYIYSGEYKNYGKLEFWIYTVH